MGEKNENKIEYPTYHYEYWMGGGEGEGSKFLPRAPTNLGPALQ